MKKEEKLKTYPEAARVVALYLTDFCDGGLDYVNMIADASRKAAERIKFLESQIAEEQKTGEEDITKVLLRRYQKIGYKGGIAKVIFDDEFEDIAQDIIKLFSPQPLEPKEEV